MSNDPEENDSEHGPAHDPPEADETVPRVDLSLRNLSVSVTGQSDDDLEAVEQSAMALMRDLVEEAEALEEDHDDYGLS
jgi:hypothetical protein